MTSARTIGRNIVSNWAGFLVHALIGFFLTPFVLRQLGDARFGVWSLVMAITGYYGLVDLGLRSGLTQYLTRYLACEDYDRMNRSASTGFVVLAGCGALLLAVSITLALTASTLFNLDQEIQSEVAWCILIIGSGTALQFCFAPFSAAFVATQRYDLSNLIGILSRVLTAIGICIGLSRGNGLVVLSGITTGCSFVDYLLRWRVAKRILPQLRVSPGLYDRGSFREFFAYGSWTFLAQCAVRAAHTSAPIIIGLLMPVAAIGRFALAVTVVKFLENLVGPAARVFFPVATHLDATGDDVGLRRIYATGTRLLSLVVVLLCLLASLFARDFFRLWIGEERVQDEFADLPSIFRVLLLGAGLWMSQFLSTQVLLGRREVRTAAFVSCSYSAMYLALTTLLTLWFDLMGAALAATISHIVFQVLVMPYVCCRSLQLPLVQYAREAYLRPIMLISLLFPFHWLKDACFPPASSWLTLAWYGLLTLVPASTVGIAIVLTRSERVMVYGKLARMIAPRIATVPPKP